jgi:uncharacterized repeat protein (TIGR01451 family)
MVRASSSHLVLLGFLLAVSASISHAQTAIPLEVSVKNETAAKEAEAGVPRTHIHALPGDTLRYRLSFTNTRAAALRNVRFDNPVPGGLRYVAGSAGASAASRVEFSIDGGQTFNERPLVEIVDDSGARRMISADPASYTHVRWTAPGPVDAGASVVAEFRAAVAPSVSPPVAVR